ATLKGGIGGGIIGTAAGLLGVLGATRRYPAFRQLTLPLRAFLVTSSGTFAAIISADRYSRKFEEGRNPQKGFTDSATTMQSQLESQKPFAQRAKDWGTANRYSIVFGSWVASMGTAFALVGRNPYLTGQQKLVQARVYAQGLTLAVVVASLALEANDRGKGEGRWETVKVLDPNDPTHKHMIEKKIHHEKYAGEDQWMDMIAAEEERMKEREANVKEQEDSDKKKGKKVKSHDDSEKGEKKSGVRAP
ncbi:hypothetical protein BT93_L1428, partial [Corymbia citriodora subsp. variegata]